MAEFRLSPPSPGSAADGTPASRPPQQTLALKVLLERLGGRPRTLLDLGTANTENVAFLSALPARLIIADLPHSLASVPTGSAFDARLQQELPDIEPGSVDAVLAWDLLNYLDPRQIGSLGGHLERLCAPEAPVFALISTLAEIPDEPRVYRIADSEHLFYESHTRGRRTCPRYNEPDLHRALPGFEVETSYLLRNGMREYLLCRAAG